MFRRHSTVAGWTYELSAGDDWDASDPRSINAWIDEQVSTRSPETSGSYQLRRIIRMGKYYTKAHAVRLRRKLPSGLVATALFIEAYVPINGRDDEAFRETLRAISNRSKFSPVYANSIQVSENKDTDPIERLIDVAESSVEELDKLDGYDTTESDAGIAWKKVFRHSFFDKIVEEATNSAFAPSGKASTLGVGLTAAILPSQAAAALSETERTERMEAAVRAQTESGRRGKPWSD